MWAIYKSDCKLIWNVDTWTDLSLWRSNTLIFSQISAFSSDGNIFGTSPEFSKLLMSSRKDSSFTCKNDKDSISIIPKIFNLL